MRVGVLLSACRQAGTCQQHRMTPDLRQYTEPRNKTQRNFCGLFQLAVIFTHKNMPVTYTIRQVDGSQRHWETVLRALQKSCLPGDVVLSPRAGWWFVATASDGRYAGFGAMSPSTRWSDCVYLSRAGVLPEFRGQGLQKRLIRIRLKTAKAIGMNWAVTDTYDNPASGNNMIACGFKLFIPSDPWGVGRTLYWRKRILHGQEGR